MKKIYKFYKERLIEISGKNRSLYSKKISQTYSYDIGRILEGDNSEIDLFLEFLWSSKKPIFNLIDKKFINRLISNLSKAKLAEKIDKKEKAKKKKDSIELEVKATTIKPLDEKTVIPAQVKLLKNLRRTIDDFEKETGRYELFIGYPFVTGFIDKDTVVKAPLLLFPAVINISDGENSASIELKSGEPIQFNKVLLTAYARHYKISLDDFELEFDDLKASKLKTIEDVLERLAKMGIRITHNNKKNKYDINTLIPFDSLDEPKSNEALSIKSCAVLGRFPLANSIYNDYTVLEQKNLTTPAIASLLENKQAALAKLSKKKPKKYDENIYTIHPLDYAQENAINNLSNSGNLVIYGPPGTGKSQTIVNIITDALVKNKRVLVVSQKKAALDVVFNRLGKLNKKAAYIIDPEKGKNAFYENIKNTHHNAINTKAVDMSTHTRRYNDVTTTLENEMIHLESISDILFSSTDYGISLAEMYSSSRIINREDGEYVLYEKLLRHPRLKTINHNLLKETLRTISEKSRADIYYKRLEMQRSNPFTDHLDADLDVHTLNGAKAFLSDFLAKKVCPYDISKHSNMRQLLGFYLENGLTKEKELMPIINYVAKLNGKKESPKIILENFWRTLDEIKAYVGEYYLFNRIFDNRGFALAIEALISCNTFAIKLMLQSLEDYIAIKDLNATLSACSPIEKTILNFAYENSSTLADFKKVLDSLLLVRTYAEIVVLEEEYKNELSLLADFENIKNRVVSLKSEQQKVVFDMCADTFTNGYREICAKDIEEKNNFVAQITRPQNLWPIRRLVDEFGEFLFNLYPCWLLSPENVSQLLPLRPELFDLILFDEASQVFVESTIPTIYRGKYIAVAGDNKQLRPTAHFVRRYMGNDDEDLDLSTQVALEVESLLDLATSRFSSSRLNYHYRSKHEELINFSNYAFYDSRLQVVPNLNKSLQNRPIERIKVDGKWIDRKNETEAKKIVALLKKILLDKKTNETIGIITFNAEQGNHISDLIDLECINDKKFREAIVLERNRKENGEDVSLFVKNLENVQGDERDVIIFSIGYAENEHGKVVSQFGPLNQEGGENRLNVAITRAKNKIFVVTSIEPERLNVEGSKNLGPRLFKKYLEYVRAVSTGNQKEVDIILSALAYQSNSQAVEGVENIFSKELKKALENHGFIIETSIGSSANKLDMAVYSKEHDSYLVGIECDLTALKASPSIIERDVLRPKFLESRSWKVIRIWSRDFWQNRTKVISQIEKVAKSELDKLKKRK